MPTNQPDLDVRKVRDLATVAYAEAKANAAFLGQPGVGKTHMVVALAVAVCSTGYSVYFTTMDDMVRNPKAADTVGKLSSKLKVHARPVTACTTIASCRFPSACTRS